MTRLTIPRRAILRGAGGVGLALPVLEIMRSSRKALAAAEACPKRFIVTYLGTSVSNCYRHQEYPGGRYDMVTPQKLGPGYESTTGLKPIFDAGVQDVMGLVSGLRIPVTFQVPLTYTNVPAAIGGGFHGCSSWPQLCGTSPFGDADRDGEGSLPTGASADQLILKVISGETLKRFPSGLQLSVSPLFKQTLSYEAPTATSRKDKWGRPLGKPIAAYTSPTEAYKAIFGGAVATPRSPADTEKLLAREKSIVDAVSKRAMALINHPGLGTGDKTRMQQYFDHIRTLETRIKTIGPSVGAGCQLPKPIVSDPPKGEESFTVPSYWSEDTQRAQLQADLIYHAFQCDQTRVVSWMFDGAQSVLDTGAMFGWGGGLHGITHSFNDPKPPEGMAKAIAWYIKPVADLVSKLKATDECGGKMIDNTVILMLLEGGHGKTSEPQDPNQGDFQKDYEAGLRFAHSHENMVIICAGGKNLGLQLGQHIHFNNDRNPAEVMYTVLKALGLNGSFGEVSTDIPEMRALQG